MDYKRMKVTILTQFPDMFGPVTTSILGRAAEKGLLELDIVNIRDYTLDKHALRRRRRHGDDPAACVRRAAQSRGAG